MEIRNLKLLTWIVTIMVVIEALSTPFVAIGANLFPGYFAATIAPIADTFDLCCLVFSILTMIVFSFWIYRAGRNLVDAGYADLEFSPASRIWWFAVPIATLFKPYQGMRELWNASHGETDYRDTVPLVATWWGLWLADNALNRVMSRFAGAEMLPFVAIADVALAAVAIAMIQRIAEAQRRLSPSVVAEVFA